MTSENRTSRQPELYTAQNVMENCHMDDLQQIYNYDNIIITKSDKKQIFFQSEELEVCTKYVLPE